MKLSDLDPAFVARLENWGMYYRDQYIPAQSATYRVCKELAAARGQGVRDGYRESNPRPEINEDDARIIEWCWGQSRYRMDPKHWAMIRAHFVMRHDKRILCRAMHIRLLSYETELSSAMHRFQSLVNMLEGLQVTDTVG